MANQDYLSVAPLRDTHLDDPPNDWDQQEIEKELNIQRNKGSLDTSLKGTKWNNYDTSSPHQLLAAEMSRVKKQPSYLDLPPSQDQSYLDTPPADIPESTAPDTLKYVGQSFLNEGARMARTGQMAIGGIASNVGSLVGHPEWGDPFFASGDAVVAANPVEGEQNANFGQKVAGAVARLPYAFAGGPEAAPAVLAANATANTGAEELQQGTPLNQAQKVAAIQGTSAAVLGATPTLAKTLPRSIALGAGVNTVGSTVADVMSQNVLTDPQAKERYDPFDPEKRGIDAIFGGVFGAVAHRADAQAKNWKDWKSNAEKYQTFIQDMVDKLSDTMDLGLPNRPKHGPDPNQHVDSKWDQDWNDLTQTVADLQNGAARKQGTVDKFLDLISHEDFSYATPEEKALAQNLQRLITHLDLDLTKVEFTKDGGNGKQGGLYSLEDDTVHIFKKPDVRTFLHEVVHAVTGHAIELRDDIAYTGRTATPAEQVIVDRVNRLQDVANFIMDKVKGDTKDRQEFMVDAHNEVLNGNVRKNYGFSLRTDLKGNPVISNGNFVHNLHEFVTETMTSKEFRDRLRAVPVTADEVAQFKVKEPRTIKNLWDLTKRALRQVIGGNEPGNTALDLAMDHIFNIAEKSDAGFRAGEMAKYQKPSQGKIAELNQRASQKELAASALKNKLSEMPEQRYLMNHASRLLKEATSVNEFKERMKLAFPSNPEWDAFVNKYGQRMFDNAPTVIEQIASESDYSKQGQADRTLTGDPRSIDEFMEQEGKPFLEGESKLFAKDDITSGGTNVLGSNWLRVLKNTGGFAGKVLKFVHDKAREYVAMEEQISARALKEFQAFNKLGRKDQLKLMDVVIEMDSPLGRMNLKNLGLQWATDEMLQGRGLSGNQIEAYHGITRGLDYLWDMLNQTRIKQGMEPLEKIPGYMPHIFEGAYKVFVVRKVQQLDPKTGQKVIIERVVRIKGFETKYGAAAFAKDLESGKYDQNGMSYRANVDENTGKPYKVTKFEDLQQNLMSSVQENLTAYHNQLMLDPQTLQTLDRIEADSMRGITKHMLERTEISGFIGEFGTGKEISFLHTKENSKIVTLYQNYAKSIAGYYKNVMFMDEVGSRVIHDFPGQFDGKTYYGYLFDRTENLSNHLRDFISNFTGNNVNHFKYVDLFIQDMSERVGIDPLAYRRFARHARNFLSMVKLRANPANYFANIIQPMYAMSLLEWANATRKTEGLDSPSAASSFAKAMANRFHPDADMISAVQWAVNQHILDPQLEYEIKSRNLSPVKDFFDHMTLGKVNPWIEGFSRETTFMVAYEHFRQIYKGDPMKARTAASNLMEMTMVNYDRASRPLMYQNFGLAGEAISPFAVFRNAYMGNMYLALKMAAKYPTMRAAWTPLIAQSITFLATAGVVGMMGASEYNGIVDLINGFWPELAIPHLEATLAKARVPDWITFGAVSAGTTTIPGLEHGAYIGGSMNSVGLDDIFSLAIVPFGKAMVDLVGLGGREALSAATGHKILPPSKNDYYAAGKQLVPGIFQRYYDSLFQEEGQDAAYKSSSMTGYIDREQPDKNALDWLGRMSLDEYKKRAIERAVDKSEQLNKQTVRKLVEIGADNAMGLHSQMDTDEAAMRAAQLGISRDEFNKQVVEEYQNRITNKREKDAKNRSVSGRRRLYERESME